jgi:hypothetical protein
MVSKWEFAIHTYFALTEKDALKVPDGEKVEAVAKSASDIVKKVALLVYITDRKDAINSMLCFLAPRRKRQSIQTAREEE